MITGTRFIVAALFSAAPAFAQDSSTVARDSTKRATDALYRDPKKAANLGKLFPGAGQIYAGEYLKGYATWIETAGPVILGAVVIQDRCGFAGVFGGFDTSIPCDGPRWRDDAVGAALIGLGGWVWVSSARDAPHAAERANERHRRHASVSPLVQVQPRNGERLLIGGELRW